ncbi:MAG: hypothetical protein ACLTDF_03770 [Coprococcus sp.]
MRYNNKQNDKLIISNGDTTQTTEIGVATALPALTIPPAASSGTQDLSMP